VGEGEKMFGDQQHKRLTVALPVDVVTREIERGLDREGLVQIARTDGYFTPANGDRHRQVVIDAWAPADDTRHAHTGDGGAIQPLVTTFAVYELGRCETAVVVETRLFGGSEVRSETETDPTATLREEDVAHMLDRLRWLADRRSWISSAA
jgi:hypothetical protein